MLLKPICCFSCYKPKLIFVQRLFAALICTCSFLCLSAQTQLRWPLQAGFSFSGISYTGDYSDGASALSRVYPGANLSLQSSNPRALKLQFNAGFGKFAEQYDTSSPNFPPGVDIPTFIETSFIYGDLRLKFHLLNNRNFQPYVSVGAGVMHFSPKDQDGRKLIRRTATRLEGEDFNDIIPELPLSGGIHFHLTRRVWMNASYTYRYTPTDYLDNVGLAGENNGFDALHSVQLGIYITLGPTPDISAAMSGASVLESPIESSSDSLKQPANETGTLTSAPGIHQKVTKEPKSTEENSAVAKEKEELWIEKAEEAISNEDFFYYRVKKGETIETLAKKFHITPDIIKKINFIVKSKIKGGDFLRMPNMGIDY